MLHRLLPRRHRLARLTAAGWAAVLRQPWDATARGCLAHWAGHGLPLVVTRQPADATAEGRLALGLPAPSRWDRRRLALRVPFAAIDGLGEFPRLADLTDPTNPEGTDDREDAAASARVTDPLPAPVRPLAREAVAMLAVTGATARVFGSHGWQAITGLDHVRPSSDLDLWIGVDDVAHADAVARALQVFEGTPPRLDGELVFADGAAVAWREWAGWRAGRARAVLVRRVDGVALRHDTAWCATSVSASPSREPSP